MMETGMKTSSSKGHGISDAVTGLRPHALLKSFPGNKTPGRRICSLQHYTLDAKYKQGKFSSKNIKFIYHLMNFITNSALEGCLWPSPSRWVGSWSGLYTDAHVMSSQPHGGLSQHKTSIKGGKENRTVQRMALSTNHTSTGNTQECTDSSGWGFYLPEPLVGWSSAVSMYCPDAWRHKHISVAPVAAGDR